MFLTCIVIRKNKSEYLTHGRMKQNEIILQLNQNHSSYIDFIYGLNDMQFVQTQQGKWSAGQQLEHIYLSVKPLTRALLLPSFLLRLLFGKANRPSRKYEVLVEKYKNKLANGGRASKKYIPSVVSNNKKEELIKKLQHTIYKLTSHIRHFNEEDLDILILPHPLLGRLTLREMLYFTVYHVKHHEEGLKKNLGYR